MIYKCVDTAAHVLRYLNRAGSIMSKATTPAFRFHGLNPAQAQLTQPPKLWKLTEVVCPRSSGQDREVQVVDLDKGLKGVQLGRGPKLKTPHSENVAIECDTVGCPCQFQKCSEVEGHGLDAAPCPLVIWVYKLDMPCQCFASYPCCELLSHESQCQVHGEEEREAGIAWSSMECLSQVLSESCQRHDRGPEVTPVTCTVCCMVLLRLCTAMARQS